MAPTITTASYPISGMTCASCVRRVEQALAGIDGVRRSQVNLATEQATVEFDSARVTPDLIRRAVEDAGYGIAFPAETGETTRTAPAGTLRRDFLISLALTIPVMSISMLFMFHPVHIASGIPTKTVNAILLILTTPILFGPGRRFFSGAWKGILHRNADMNTLVAVGTGTAWGYSTIAVLFPGWLGAPGTEPHVYFETAAAIITLILLGKYLESSAKRKAGDAIRTLMNRQPKTAAVLRGGTELRLPVSSVVIGDEVIVKPGEQFPVDGIVLTGYTAADESMVTGESMPVEKHPGDPVTGGTLNGNGSVLFRATAVGDRTVVAQIGRLIEQAQTAKAPVQDLADRIASVFVPVVIGIAVLTFSYWYFLAGAEFTTAMLNCIAVLIIACPCALGLATPTAIMVGTGAGASGGILIRDPGSMEKARRLTTLVLDKTGTITAGRPGIAGVHPASGFEAVELLRLAASVEQRSEHPMARAIVEHAEAAKLNLQAPDEFRSTTGFGVEGTVSGRRILVGREDMLTNAGIAIKGAAALPDGRIPEGQSPVFVAVDGSFAGVIGVADRIKPTSATAVREIRSMNINVVLITGDHETTARAIAREAGITTVVAGVLPGEKASAVASMQETGGIVGMAGDGINDAPALAQADVGFAMGTGTDVAMEAAAITVMSGDLMHVARALRLSSRTIGTIRQNLFWAFIYNCVGIPLAAMGLLSPVLAAGAMAFSSVSVISNSLRLRRFRQET